MVGRHEPARHSVHAELLGHAEVREQQDTDRVLAGAAARRADAALPTEAAHAGACADGAALELGARGGNCLRHVCGLNMRDARIGEPAVVALADDGDHDVVCADAGVGGHRNLHGPLVDAADRVRRGEVDVRLEQSPLPDLVRAGQLAGAVQHRDARRGRQERGHDRGHAGHLDRDMADGHADVGDGVARPRLERADHDAVLARA